MSWDVYLIFVFLAIIVPWRGRLRLKKIMAAPRTTAAQRIALYASTIAFQWFALAVVAWRAWAHRFTAVELGLIVHKPLMVGIVAVVGTAAFSSLHWLNLRRVGSLPVDQRGSIQTLAEKILPQSKTELLPFIALAITAGICEELIYRGFAMAALARTALPGWSVVLISAALFGLAHLYQGAGGLVGTLLMGILFGVTRMLSATVVAVIFWHVAVDVVAGVAGWRYLQDGSMAHKVV
jgi:membrane protease YdiL (CAAX protease family)